MVELPDHPHFIGCQFHPEFKSKPLEPHPLFSTFVGAAYEHGKKRRAEKESAAVEMFIGLRGSRAVSKRSTAEFAENRMKMGLDCSQSFSAVSAVSAVKGFRSALCIPSRRRQHWIWGVVPHRRSLRH